MKETQSKKFLCILGGVGGIVGVTMLIISFAINYGPPLDSPDAEFTRFVQVSYTSILWGAWLQAVGPMFIVLLAFVLVHLAGATTRVVGWMTFFGATVLTMVSLIEITFYIGALFLKPVTMTASSFHFIYAAQHLYFMVAAPALFIPLGIVLVTSRILPRLLGYLALLLGALFAVMGVTSLLTLTLPGSVTSLGSLQALWWFATAITLIARNAQISRTQPIVSVSS